MFTLCLKIQTGLRIYLKLKYLHININNFFNCCNCFCFQISKFWQFKSCGSKMTLKYLCQHIENLREASNW